MVKMGCYTARDRTITTGSSSEVKPRNIRYPPWPKKCVSFGLAGLNRLTQSNPYTMWVGRLETSTQPNPYNLLKIYNEF